MKINLTVQKRCGQGAKYKLIFLIKKYLPLVFDIKNVRNIYFQIPITILIVIIKIHIKTKFLST